MWKILTAQIKGKIYYSLISCGIFTDEQKGCRKRTRGTEELQYIDQHILNESKTRRKNLALAWIDYEKTNNMVPQSWTLHRLKMYKTPNEVIKFIEKTWRVELITGGKSLQVKIQRGIFQGGALSPLLFVIAMMPLSHILRKCTAGYKPSKLQERSTIRCTWMTWNWQKFKKFGNPNTDSENIQSRHRNRIWHRKMGQDSNGTRETTHDGRNQTTKSSKNQNARRKGNLQILGYLGGLTPSDKGRRKKKLKRSISEKPESYARQNYLAETLSMV